MMETLKFAVIMLIIFLLPFFISYYLNKKINRLLAQSGTKIKLMDLLTIYFMMGIHIFTHEIFNQSFFPHLIIVISILGIILASLFRLKNKHFPLRRFNRIWWRLVDLLLVGLYILFGIWFFINLIINS